MERFRRFRRWPVLVVVAAVVLVSGGGIAFAVVHRSGSSASTTDLVAAKRATIDETVSASGTIEPSSEADLDFAVSGRITAVKVKGGQQVHKGQVLATVGSQALADDVAAAKATLAAAEETAADDGDSSSAQQAADNASVTAARSSLAAARQELADAALRATMAGTVTSVDLTKGESVSDTSSSTSGADSSTAASSASSSSTSSDSSGASQVVIQATKSFVVDASVSDTDVKQVKKGQRATITPDGASTGLSGTVASVSAVSTSSSGTVTFPIVVRVSGHPSDVYAGASATVAVTTEHKADVLEIPTFAITYSGSTASVTVSTNGSTAKRTITVGTSYGLETQVVSGLRAGEKVVVTTPSFGLRTGTGSGSGRSGTGEFPSGGFGSGGFGSGGGSGGFPSGGFGSGGFGGQ